MVHTQTVPILITGAGLIGRHVARELSARGESVTLLDRRTPSIELPAGVRFVAGDMTNTAFMAPGGRVGLFVPASMPDNFFWFISQIRGHRYAEYRCAEIRAEEARQAHGQSWNADLRLTRAEFRKFIAG